MSLWIYVIIVLGLWILLPTLIPDSKTETRKMAVRIKQVKCPRCRKKFDPVANVISDALSHCETPKCGLENVNIAKLQRRLDSAYHLFKQDEPRIAQEDLVELDFDEPLVIHVIDSDNKYVE